MPSVWSDFKKFAFKGNVIELAVAVVLGTAFTAIVNSIVNGVIMPLIGTVVPGGDWKTWTVGELQLGLVLSAIVNFLIVAAVLYIVVVKVMRTFERRPDEPPPAISDEVKLLTEIRDLLRTRG